MCFAAFVFFVVPLSPQTDITDAQLEQASGERRIRVGPASGGGRIVTLPLEVYVARVLAGEGEPRASAAAHQALAVAIRTYALANAGRHGRDGFDLCDSTHCQVPRAATPASRRAALDTAGRVLLYEGRPAELFYSASCGGFSERADDVWPGVDYPYLRVAADDVHGDDQEWTVETTLADLERALRREGFEGRLRVLRIGERNASGRVARLELSGLVPDVISGEQFRGIIGTTQLRSTAFAMEQKGAALRFTGRGYGHGVGMCVIGAGRRAARGERMEAILAQYYPGLELARVPRVPEVPGVLPEVRTSSTPGTPSTSGTLGTLGTPGTPGTLGTLRTPRGVVVQVPEASSISGPDLERLTLRAHQDLSRTLGVSVAPISVRLHDSIESFRVATGRPWWVSSVSKGTDIDLVPAALLAQRDGLETTLRVAVAELLVSEALRDRPLWTRTGAARYFARAQPPGGDKTGPAPACPTDAELRLAISAAAQRAAEARAEACFARDYARTKNWRAVK